jgi:CCR4-NOT transcription complex subunit 6
LHEPDIICLQEVEAEQYTVFFYPQITIRGYKGVFHSKSRARTMDQYSSRTVDGCCIFWKDELFECVMEELVEFQALALKKFEMVGQQGMNRLMTKDNIAIVALLKPKGKLKINNGPEVDQLIVVNTHIHWDPACEDVKSMQVQMLTEKLEMIEKAYRSPCGHPLLMVICGDFNSGPDSAVYQLLNTKDVSGNHADLAQYDYGHYSKEGLHHKIELQSSYNVVCGEPAFTNYTGDFIGVLDYIWFTDDTISVEQVLTTLKEEVVLSHNGALPNPYICSDHICLVADFAGKIRAGKELEKINDYDGNGNSTSTTSTHSTKTKGNSRNMKK